MANGHDASMDTDDDDELLCELDVHLGRSENLLYLFQYPIRPYYRPYDEISFTSARIKEKHSLVEMDLLIDSETANYYSSRGKQFASCDSNDNSKNYFHSDRMDKQTLASTTATPSNQYFAGLFDGATRRIVLVPLRAILQLRPQFNYLDKSSSSTATITRETNSLDDDPGNVSDGEQSGSETEESKPLAASLVTMKFAKKESEYSKQKRLLSYAYHRQLRDDDRWQELACIMNAQSMDAQRLRTKLLSTNIQALKSSNV